MRGKVEEFRRFGDQLRITPAYAGKSRISGVLSCTTGDHPRLCGEKANKTIKTANAEGSPPPMRGKDANEATTPDAKGITPAYAGKSGVGAVVLCGTWDHPRLCGEKRPPPLQSAEWLGSPPPMRGKDR